LVNIVIDSSLVLALLVPNDKWHQQSLVLLDMLEDNGYTSIYLDCVASEAVSAAIRRLHEKQLYSEIPKLFERLESIVTADRLTWVLPDVPRLYTEILDLMRASSGALNFHDALIALACRDRQISLIASFDADFDQIHWLRRLSAPQDLSKFTITE